jgi:WD40 repeat protein
VVTPITREDGVTPLRTGEFRVIRNDSVDKSKLTGVTIAACSLEGKTTVLFDAGSHQLLGKVLIGEDIPRYITMDPTGSRLAISTVLRPSRTGALDHVVYILDVKSFEMIFFFETGNNYSSAVALSSDGQLTGDIRLKTELVPVPINGSTRCWSISSYQFCNNDERIIGGCDAGFVVWDTETGLQLWTKDMNASKANANFVNSCYVFAPGLEHTSFVSKKMTKVIVWDTENKMSRRIIDNEDVGIDGPVETMCFGPKRLGTTNSVSDLLLYICTGDSKIVVIDLSTLARLHAFDIKPYPILRRTLVYNYAMNTLITGYSDIDVSGVVMYAANTGERVGDVQFNVDGAMTVACTAVGL